MGTEKTEVRLGRWREGGLWAGSRWMTVEAALQRAKKMEEVDSPGPYVDD